MSRPDVDNSRRCRSRSIAHRFRCSFVPSAIYICREGRPFSRTLAPRNRESLGFDFARIAETASGGGGSSYADAREFNLAAPARRLGNMAVTISPRPLSGLLLPFAVCTLVGTRPSLSFGPPWGTERMYIDFSCCFRNKAAIETNSLIDYVFTVTATSFPLVSYTKTRTTEHICSGIYSTRCTCITCKLIKFSMIYLDNTNEL